MSIVSVTLGIDLSPANATITVVDDDGQGRLELYCNMNTYCHGSTILLFDSLIVIGNSLIQH